MRALLCFIVGLTLGPIAWALASVASGTFEPFDSATGFFVCQAVLASALFVVALRAGLLRALACLVGVWIGMNAYVYAVGSSETRAWIVLLWLMSLTLLLFPLAAAIAGGVVRAVRARRSAARPASGR